MIACAISSQSRYRSSPSAVLIFSQVISRHRLAVWRTVSRYWLDDHSEGSVGGAGGLWLCSSTGILYRFPVGIINPTKSHRREALVSDGASPRGGLAFLRSGAFAISKRGKFAARDAGRADVIQRIVTFFGATDSRAPALGLCEGSGAFYPLRHADFRLVAVIASQDERFVHTLLILGRYA